MDIRSRTELFGNMVRCCHNLYMWEYDQDLNLLYTNCESVLSYTGSISMNVDPEMILRNCTETNRPVIMNNDMDLTWVVVPMEKTGVGPVFYVLGPLFIDAVSVQSIEASLSNRNLSPNFGKERFNL